MVKNLEQWQHDCVDYFKMCVNKDDLQWSNDARRLKNRINRNARIIRKISKLQNKLLK